jgi:hypothetical protein
LYAPGGNRPQQDDGRSFLPSSSCDFNASVCVTSDLAPAHFFLGNVMMPSKSETYLAKADECEQRAREMPPALRREFLMMAAEWRKLASTHNKNSSGTSSRSE